MCAVAAMLSLAVVELSGIGSVHAQGFDPTVSHITPFPEKDTYRTYVLGDAMGDGLSIGLADALRDEPGIEFFKKTKANSGFTRPEIQDWSAIVKETSAKEKFHIAIIVMGAADRRPIPVASDKKRPFLVGTEEWKQEYGRRVDEFLKAFRRSSAAIYWIGLPVMKAANASDDMQMINAIVREKVSVHGGKFIDTWNGFADVNGQYSQTGPDVTGKVKPLRDADGVHFSRDGYRKLAHFVERELRRDLAIAKAERNVPLAGTETEQRRVNPAKAAAARAAAQDAAGPVVAAVAKVGAASGRDAGGADLAVGVNSGASAGSLAGTVAGAFGETAPLQDQKAETARVSVVLPADGGGRSETIAIEIVRPAISAQVIGHVTRNASVHKAAPVGENIMQSLPGGLLTMSSVTTVTELAGAARRSMPTTQTPHFKVLVKGEAMPAKPGRVDDFRWPRDANLW